MLTVQAGGPGEMIVYPVIQGSPCPRIRLTFNLDGLHGSSVRDACILLHVKTRSPDWGELQTASSS
jgi:hypothetical protein